MPRKDDEKEFRLRPRKPHAPKSRNEGVVWATAFKRIMHYARTSRKAARGVAGTGSQKSEPSVFPALCRARILFAKHHVGPVAGTRALRRARKRHLRGRSEGGRVRRLGAGN